MKTELIALSKLDFSPENVRKTFNKDGMHEMKASIMAHGVMQNLIVAKENDRYLVIAGSRRLTALQDLCKEGKISKEELVPCQISEEKNNKELSLAENVMREAMHPADEYEAYASLIAGGKTSADVAIRFGCSLKHVEQRLQLGKVAPEIMKAFRAGKIDLKTLMAFTICPDQKKQVNVWKSLKEHERSAWSIMQKLTDKMFSSDSGVAKFVGREAYKKAGGQFHSDLFATNDSEFFEDGALLQKLADEKVAKKIEALKVEGWGFVEFGNDSGWEFCNKYDRLDKQPKKSDLKDCGVYLYITSSGKIDQTLLRNRKNSKNAKGDTKNKPAGISQALIDDLKAYRMEAMQVFFASNFDSAYDILSYSAAMSLCDNAYYSDHFSELHFSKAMSSKNVANEETPAKKVLKALKTKLNFTWNKGSDSQKFEAFMLLPIEDRSRFMAYAFALTIKGRIDIKPSAYTLAGQYLDVDMASLWRPTYENYFKRVDQATIDKIGKELFLIAWKSSKNKSKDAKFIAAAIADPKKAAGSDLKLIERLEGWLPSGMSFSRSGEAANESSKASDRDSGGKFAKKAIRL